MAALPAGCFLALLFRLGEASADSLCGSESMLKNLKSETRSTKQARMTKIQNKKSGIHPN
jgi:hypothetical protein